MGWEERPFGRSRLAGTVDDPEDNLLKELLIAAALLDLKRQHLANEASPGIRNAGDSWVSGHSSRANCLEEAGVGSGGRSLLELGFPIMVGRMHPCGHPEYPGMGSFFEVQGGGGTYPTLPSPASGRAAAAFLREHAGFSKAAAERAARRSVESAVRAVTRLQGCELWRCADGLAEAELSAEERELVGKGYAGPPVDLHASSLTVEQVMAQSSVHAFSFVNLDPFTETRIARVNVREANIAAPCRFSGCSHPLHIEFLSYFCPNLMPLCQHGDRGHFAKVVSTRGNYGCLRHWCEHSESFRNIGRLGREELGNCKVKTDLIDS